ncbi:MAG: hypothetical protein M1587_12100, partial [Thaumarchaeota archaeon]|nr:hypothetical protein [Nitrososphaerota archaeon]
MVADKIKKPISVLLVLSAILSGLLFFGFVPVHPKLQALSSEQQSSFIEFPLRQPDAYPLGIAIDGKGHIWFAEANTDLLVEFFPSNQTFVSFPIPTEPHLAMIWFLLFDRYGNLWFADPVQPLLWRFTPSTHVFANFTTADQYLKAYDLAYNSASNRIWFTAVYSNQIGAFQIESDGSAQIISSVSLPTTDNGNTGPSGITFDASGNLFVSESFAGKIVEYDPATGSFSHVWNLP